MPTDPKGPVVLVVEDEWLLREELTAALRKEGLKVIEARNGELAVTLLQERASFDVLITDILLGGRLTGWDVAQSFRATHPEGRVIYASGSPVDKAKQVTDSVFFSKPCNVTVLIDACRKAKG